MVNKRGEISSSIDIIIYDRLTCPVFLLDRTAILPIEGVYGIIEVKSTLSKAELEDAAAKITRFKKMAPGDLGMLDVSGHTLALRRPSRPFGIVFGYKLAENSLSSLVLNLEALYRLQPSPINLVNITCVLGVGNILLEAVRWDLGQKFLLMATDEISSYFEMIAYDKRSGIKTDAKYHHHMISENNPDSFGRFLSYLQILLSGMLLNIPDVGGYFGVDMPPLVMRQS